MIHDPNSNHIKFVTEWAKKRFRKSEISKERRSFIISEDAQPGKNFTFYKTQK